MRLPYGSKRWSTISYAMIGCWREIGDAAKIADRVPLRFDAGGSGGGGAFGGFEAGFGAGEVAENFVPIGFGVAVSGEEFARAIGVGLGARNIDFFGALSGVGEDDDAIGQDFGEAADHGDEKRVRALFVAERGDAELGEQRRVAGQDAEKAVAARQLNFGDGRADDAAFERDDFELEGFGQHCVWLRRGSARWPG
jgi:hypothetical protein